MRASAVSVLLLLALFVFTTAVPLNIVKDKQTSETLSVESTEQRIDNDSNENGVVESKDKLVDSSFDSISSEERLWPIIPSEEESNDSNSAYEEHKDKVKRSLGIPDVDLCEEPKDNTHNEHDEYLRYKYEQDNQRYRRAAGDTSSEGDSSSLDDGTTRGAADAPTGQSAANAPRSWHRVDGDDISEEKSSEEKSDEANIKCGCISSASKETPASRNSGNSADSSRRRRHVKNDNTSFEPSADKAAPKCGCSGAVPEKTPTVQSSDSDADATRRRRRATGDISSSDNSYEAKAVKEVEEPNAESSGIIQDKQAGKKNSVEDYVQGCEVMAVNSYEANETTYNEERRRRDARKMTDSSDSSDSQDSNDESDQKQQKTHETDRKRENQGNSAISEEDDSELSDSSIEQVNIRQKRSADESEESNSNSNSKEDEKTDRVKKVVVAAVVQKEGEVVQEGQGEDAKLVEQKSEGEAKPVQPTPEEANPATDSQTAVN